MICRNKFCWLPTLCVDGKWAWLEFVEVDINIYTNAAGYVDTQEVYSKIIKRK